MYSLPPTVSRVFGRIPYENEISDWCDLSAQKFDNLGFEDANQNVWVIKYIRLIHLEHFLNESRMVISTTPGFTWGDGVYVSPLKNAYSTAIYGRAGIVGYIPRRDIGRVYDAADPYGIELYQKWIITQKTLFENATTKVYAKIANRYLRNLFRFHYEIDLIFFHPDEFNESYVRPTIDYWFTISDWQIDPDPRSHRSLHNVAHDDKAFGKAFFSDRIKDCRWVVRVEEQFITKESTSERQHLMGKLVRPPSDNAMIRGTLENTLKIKHAAQFYWRSRTEPNKDDVYRLRI